MMDYVDPKKVRIGGTLASWLDAQAAGLTYHMGVAGYPFDRVEWGKAQFDTTNGNPGWWVYEQTAYVLDGATRLAIARGDKEGIARSRRIVNRVLNHPAEDGFLGPDILRESEKRGCDRWAFVVFFRAVIALYEYKPEKRILDAMERHYLGSKYDYANKRDFLNLEIILWLYGKTKNEALLKMAEDTFEKYQTEHDTRAEYSLYNEHELSRKKPWGHGVSYNEYTKIGAILYRYTKKKEYLIPAVRSYEKLVRYHGLPGGCHSSSEWLMGAKALESQETCDVTDYTWSLSYMGAITKNGKYFDRIERCIYNAGFGAILENFGGLQYFSCANQVICDRQSDHNGHIRGGKWMSYRPNPGTECCPGNFNRFLPNFALHLFAKDRGVWATLYGEATYEERGIRIEEKTNYPFEDAVRFKIETARPFALYLRIPGNAKGYTVEGAECAKVRNGFVKVNVTGNCEIVLTLDFDVEKIAYDGGLYFRRGALVYALGEKGERRVDQDEKRQTKDFPAYEIYATKPWNFAVCKDTDAKYTACENARAFDLDTPLPTLTVKGAELPDWTIAEEAIKNARGGNVQNLVSSGAHRFTPDIPREPMKTGKKQDLVLRPMAACKLRITVFPVAE